MILKILDSPHPKLLKRSGEIKKIDQPILKLAFDMLETKQANFGIGLAANQVGELKRIIVIGAEKEIIRKHKIESPEIPQTVLVNPKITKFSKEKESFQESCLSLPGIGGLASRAKEVVVRGIKIDPLNYLSKLVKIKASGLFARVIQHEIDHLDGILFPNRVGDLKTLTKVPVPYKIVFLGTPEFAVPILESLIKNGWGISAIITEPDRPTGRKQILTPSPIKKAALKHNLLVYQPETISNLKSQISNLRPDLIILAAYGQILPEEILEIPKYGTLCIHPSLLPKYRGPSPIQFTILNGEKETGVTIFKADEKIDHGPIVANSKLKMQNLKLTTKELSKKLAQLGSQLLLNTLTQYLSGKIKLKSQNHKKATYTRLIKKEDGFIDKSEIRNPKSEKELHKIERKIRAFYPWPKVWTKINSKRVIIHKTHIEDAKLILDIVQPEGKKPMKYQEYLKGNPKIA